MKKLENMFGGIGKGAAAVGLGLTALLFSTESCTPAQQKVVAGEVIMEEAETPGEYMVGYLLKTAGTMEHDIEVAEAGKDEININIEGAAIGERSTKYENVVYTSENKYLPAPGYEWLNNKKGDYRVIKRGTRKTSSNSNKNIPLGGLHSYNKWVDLNKNNVAEKDEFFGFDKKVFNLNKEYMKIYFIIENREVSSDVTFRSWTTTGQLIGETTDHVLPRKVHRRWTGLDSKYSSPKDFVDKLKDAGPGKYIITANVEGENKTHKIEVEIVE